MKIKIILLLSVIFSLLFLVHLFKEKQDNKKVINKLNDYKATITYITGYYKSNGFYPDKIPQVNSAFFPYYKYEIKNNGKDFVLFVNDNNNPHLGYRFCSSADLKRCKAIGYDKKSKNTFKQVGDWVEESYE